MTDFRENGFCIIFITSASLFVAAQESTGSSDLIKIEMHYNESSVKLFLLGFIKLM